MSDREKLIELILESFTPQLAERVADYLIQSGVVLANRTPIENFDMSLRAYNALKRAGINTIEELRDTDASVIERMRGVGAMTLVEILRIRNGGISHEDAEKT